MLITCEKCQSIYAIADQVIGENGRKVKCAKCAHVWLAAPEVDAEPVNLHNPFVSEAFEDNAEIHPHKSSLKLLPILLLMMIFLISLIAFPGFFVKIPPFGYLFEKYGLYHDSDGMVLSDVKYNIIDGELVVTGKFINITSQAKTTPYIRYILLDKDKQVIFNNITKQQEKSTEAYGESAFYAKITNLNKKAAYLVLDTDHKLELPLH